MASWLFLLAIGMLLVLLCVYRMTRRVLKCIAFTAVSGIGTLGLVWLVGRFVIIPLGITPLSLLISGVLGIPGVIGMLVFCLL